MAISGSWPDHLQSLLAQASSGRGKLTGLATHGAELPVEKPTHPEMPKCK